ncbi:DUF4423 domain-containing protein [Bdellovibrio sp. HCB2-146]|uniref:DUF4423 domain-containing protein n=1 Tax=Bdellovibrio sp. HCB2-146 TaxID=3394362 RepID=UPI0039BC8037
MEMRIADFMRIQLEKRKQKNPRYSLRSFARNLDISSGKLSDIIAGKVCVGPRIFAKIENNLSLSEAEKRHLRFLYQNERKNSRLLGGIKRQLQESEYALIASPEHFEILALMETRDAVCDYAWIKKRLGYSKEKVESALTVLLQLNMIEMVDKNRFRVVYGGATTSHDIPSEIIRQSHRNVILNSLEKLDECSVNERDFSSITMAVNPEKMDQAKKMIRDFRRRLCRLMESGEKSEVYTLNVQLFPNTLLQKRR